MKVLLSCLQALQDHPIPAYSFWEVYFKKGLEEAGIEWVEVPGIDWAEGLAQTTTDGVKYWKEKAWSRTLDYLSPSQGNRVDLFLSYLFPEQIDPSAISEMKRLGIPCVNFFCDNLREFRKVPEPFHCFTLHWVPEYQALSMYQQAGYEHIHLPMPMWVPEDFRSVQVEEVFPPTFIGSRDIQREHLFAQVLSQLETPLLLRGRGWQKEEHHDTSPPKSFGTLLDNQLSYLKKDGLVPFVRKILDNWRKNIPSSAFDHAIGVAPQGERDYFNMIRQSEIALGVNRFPSYRYPFTQPGTYSRLRDIEAPMLGACYLTEWTEGLSDLYDLGVEIETYKNAEEMVSQIDKLVSHRKLRNSLRHAGQRRALAEHTIPMSMRKILKRLGLS
ncbi:MAG: glycosyltransferase family 1 protein [Bdellovibrionales bacterium]|nr:glycosyltransferase family 1 protein [Bdellovibrionales bacterium]